MRSTNCNFIYNIDKRTLINFSKLRTNRFRYLNKSTKFRHLIKFIFKKSYPMLLSDSYYDSLMHLEPHPYLPASTTLNHDDVNWTVQSAPSNCCRPNPTGQNFPMASIRAAPVLSSSCCRCRRRSSSSR